jgi:hypothetical protein
LDNSPGLLRSAQAREILLIGAYLTLQRKSASCLVPKDYTCAITCANIRFLARCKCRPILAKTSAKTSADESIDVRFPPGFSMIDAIAHYC